MRNRMLATVTALSRLMRSQWLTFYSSCKQFFDFSKNDTFISSESPKLRLITINDHRLVSCCIVTKFLNQCAILYENSGMSEDLAEIQSSPTEQTLFNFRLIQQKMF
jgi:hypothetical protein